MRANEAMAEIHAEAGDWEEAYNDLRAEVEELRRSRDGWEADALSYAKSRDYHVQIAETIRAENARLREALEQAMDYIGTGDEEGAGRTIIRALLSEGAELDTGCPVAPRGAWLSSEQLREIEWAGSFIDCEILTTCCPVCRNDPSEGHATDGAEGESVDCWLAAAIKQTEEDNGQS